MKKKMRKLIGHAEVTTGPNDWYASKIDCTAVTVYGTSMEQDAEAGGTRLIFEDV